MAYSYSSQSVWAEEKKRLDDMVHGGSNPHSNGYWQLSLELTMGLSSLKFHRYLSNFINYKFSSWLIFQKKKKNIFQFKTFSATGNFSLNWTPCIARIYRQPYNYFYYAIWKRWKDTPSWTFLPFFCCCSTQSSVSKRDFFSSSTDAHNHIIILFRLTWFPWSHRRIWAFFWKTNKWRFIEMFFLRLLLLLSFSFFLISSLLPSLYLNKSRRRLYNFISCNSHISPNDEKWLTTSLIFW